MSKRILHTISKDYVNKYGLDESYLGKKIVIYHNRYVHIQKHKKEFSSEYAYNNVIKNMDLIVKEPDFIVIDPKKNGIEFVKKLGDNVLVVVRLSDSSELKVKSLYPVNDTKVKRLYLSRTK